MADAKGKGLSGSFGLLLFSAVCLLGPWLVGSAERTDTSCNRVFTSSDTIRTFEAPTIVQAKPFQLVANTEQGNLLLVSSNATGNQTQQHRPAVTQCLYKFIGSKNERVSVNFSSFNLRGDEPECNSEYIDIYIRFKWSELGEAASESGLSRLIGAEPPNGRFCTSLVPRRLLSLHNMIVVAFYSELAPPTGKRLFRGSFEFGAEPAEPAAPNCSYTFESRQGREGEFRSPTYSGVYAKGLRCAYRFVGEPEERVRLEFLDLDLYSGGSHCPLDSVRVFDGPDEGPDTPLINTICGSHRSLVVYSTRNQLLITFATLERESEVQNRGFSGLFEFSDQFVRPTFIQGRGARHIRGSECDQRLVSEKGTSGEIVSPPEQSHRNNAVCRYIFEGLQTALDYEKVLLKFTEFNLKSAPKSLAHSSAAVPGGSGSGSGSDLGGSGSAGSAECPDNYVRLYTGEQKADQKQDPNDYDFVFCGNESLPQSIESDAASLLMEYNSGSSGGSFRAQFRFIDDYRIAGTQITSGCDYAYRSEIMRTGSFNSPRHPSWYISNVNCSYTFLTQASEVLLLQFGTFKMANTFGENALGYNENCNGEDRVEIFELTLDASTSAGGGLPAVVSQTEIGTYCGTTTPGPLLSLRPVRINFRSNSNRVHYGFSAGYHFYPVEGLKTNEFVSNCGAQIVANQRHRTGTFASPETYRPETYEKRNHICFWNITARANHRIALDFSRFELEGSPSVRGCITASVRLQLSKAKVPAELCGTIKQNASKSGHQFVSDGEWLGVQFISTKQASGSNGFSAVWTEIRK